MAATRKRWYVGEDGCIPIGEPAASVTYHSSLSSIIVATKEPAIKVYDVTSGSVLQKSNLSAAKGDALHCVFLPKKDRIFFSDSRAVGVRKDLHGVLMLDTALQTPVAKTEEIVKLELPLAEAVQLLKSLSHAEISGIDFVDEVIKELGKQIEIAQEATKGNHKTIKWATVCLELQHCALKNVCSSLVAEMRRLNQHSPGLSIASTVTDRLGYLLPSSQPEITSGPVERTLMYSEAARRETFSKWPHMNYKWALPEPMAQAGFYHQPNSSGDDRAMCFTCSVCLVCWEPTDEPWSEHERHSPSCPYVKGEHTQNVPLSVTYATQPAMTHGERGDRIECVSSTSCDKFVATSTRNGNVVIWDVGHILKKYSQFSLDPSETVVALKTGVQVERCPSLTHYQQQKEKDNNNTISTSSCKLVASLEKQTITSLPQGAEGLDSTDAISVKNEPSAPVTFTRGNDAIPSKGLHDTTSEVDCSTPDTECKWKRPCEDVVVSSLCLVEKLVTQSSRTSTVQHNQQGAKQDNVATTPQPTLICGVSLRKSKLSINSEAPRYDAEGSRTTDVQLMNKVNEVVSGDHSLQIIISSENSDKCKCSPEEEILNATSFLPYILVTSVCEDNKKLTKLASTDSLKPVVSTSNIVPTLGALTMNQDWDLLDQMYYSDPDPDVQIIGFTPGPSSVSTSGPTEAKFSLEGGYEESQGKTSSVDGAIRKVNSIPSSGTILQCVELPEAFHFKDMEVRQILPTPDGHHILVIVSNQILDSSHSLVSVISDSSQTSEEGYTTCCENSASAENASVDSSSKTNCNSSKWGGILCYRLEFDSDCHYASINESPLAVYRFESADSVQTAVLLPQDISDQSEDELTDLVEGETNQGLEVSRKPVGSDSFSELQGLIAVIFSSGKLSVFTVNNFSLLAEISPPEEDRFTGVTYCSGLDRLCVCSALGKLYLYQLSEDLPESMESLVEAGGNSSPVYPSQSQTAGAKLKENRPSTQDLPEAKATATVLDSRDSIPNRNRLKQGTGSELLAKQDLSFDNLVLLHQLTRFENLLPRFTATVPPCWNEIQQEQQQRRHPQHLQHQGEASQHTRTWKLQTDSNTWDEHLFEIVLPRMCCVGHVDVKFSFHPLCTSAPHIEMTLLKQNVSNLGRQSGREKSEDSLASNSTKVNSHRNSNSTGDEPGSIPVDNPINFGIKFSAANDMDVSSGSQRGGISARNSVLDPLFLESHNAEILCGPINIASCLDLSGNCGQVSLTSPQLLLSKPRSFLLHIKGFQDKNDAPDKGKESRKRTSAPTSATSDKSKAKTIKAQFENYASVYGAASISGKFKLENLRGCDWIQEISVTIRKTKKTHLQKDRLQRNAMLELTSFHEKLISIVALDESSILPHVSPDYLQNLVLDILMWITFIQMHDPDRRIFSKCILMTLQKRLGPLVKACFIQGTRTTAHKCARLMALCMEFCKSAVDPNLAPSFSLSLLEAIMESLPFLPCAYSSGAVKWYFTLLNRVKCMDIVTVSESCADLLKNTAKQYHSRTLPSHALLRSRYGVYGHPFEPDLFDMDLPVAMKQCQTTPSVPASYASVVSSTVGGTGSSIAACDQQEELDFYDLFIIPSEKSSKAQIEYARNSILGMLEVEPLHFTCHSTSDGTKMEKLDSAGNNSTAAAAAASTGLNPTGLTGTINFGEGIPPPQLSQMSGTGMAYSLQSTMASAKHQLQELSMKNYPTVKHKIMHIKQILSEVGKAIPQIAKSSTASAELVPSTPKTTPQVMTPPLTPPNEAWHQLYLGGSIGSKGTPSGASQQQQRMSVNVLQTQALLQPPTPQVLVVERMHSGARRFVILDFGKSILLTDVIIPACADLASLSIDVWVQQEEVDGQRLIVASDIGSRSLVMNDIMPPPVCRFLKLTTIGRYGSGTTRSRIPIGAFYGHSYILPWEWNSGSDQVGGTTSCQLDLTTQSQLLTQLGSFLSLQEDIQCRYSLSRTRLENLLSQTDSYHYTTSHTQYYLQRGKKNNDEDNNIIQAYNECLQLQLQQNLAQRAIDRLKNAIGLRLPTSTTRTTDNLMLSLKHATIDKLRFLLECLLEVLLISTNPSASIPQLPISLYTAMAPQGCEALFKHLCVHGTRRIQILSSMLLVRVCGSQKWFGDFMGNMLQEFFQSDYSQVFPQDRLFVLLLAMGQRTLQGPAAVSMMESILGMLAKVLSPLSTGQPSGASALQAGNIDLSLVGWILLFLCRNLDNTFTSNGEDADRGASKKDQGTHLPNRWNFIQAENTFGNKIQKSKSVKLSRRSLQKRLLHHKQKLIDLEQVKHSFMWQGDKSSQNISNSILKQQEKQFKKELSQYASKHLKDIIQIRKTDAEILRKLQRNPRATAEAGSDNGGTELDQDNGLLILPKTRCLPVVRGLIALLLGMDFTCNVDLFLITCKVLARICVATRPAISLVEVMSAEQLKQLILLTSSMEFNHGNISWGGPWAGHALTCLLQDILEGERLYPVLDGLMEEEASVAEGQTNGETDDILQQNGSLSTFEESDLSNGNGSSGEETVTQTTKDDIGKLSFEKESSLMVDMLLDEEEYDDDTSDKLHAYVTGESIQPPIPPALHVVQLKPWGSSSMNGGTLDMNNPILMLSEEEEKYSKTVKAVIGGMVTQKTTGGMSNSSNSLLYSSSVGQGLSTALDARLEIGLETQPELRLRVMLSLQTEMLQNAFSSSLPTAPLTGLGQNMPSMTATDDELSETHTNLSPTSSNEMLSNAFDDLFAQLLLGKVNLDSLIQLWLTLNEEGTIEEGDNQTLSDSSRVPLIPLSLNSVSSLLACVATMPSLPVRTWVLVFQSLTLLANLKIPCSSDRGADTSPMANAMLADGNLISVITKFLSGMSNLGPMLSAAQSNQVGPSGTKVFYEFLQRLHVKCADRSTQNLKELMLKMVYSLTADRGAFQIGVGPLDAQCKFLDFILDMSYDNVDISNAISVIESASVLVHQHILCQEKVQCRSSGENLINARSCFGGLFASLLRGGDCRTGVGDTSRDLLMCSLLKLVCRLVSVQNSARGSRSTATEEICIGCSDLGPMTDFTKLSQQVLGTATCSSCQSDEEKFGQTDEQKTGHLSGITEWEGNHQTASDSPGTHLADIILGHRPIMCNLIQALSYCNSNTMAMILGSRGVPNNMQETLEGGDPLSVGDGIYHILVMLFKRCSDGRLILESLFLYLSGGFSSTNGSLVCRLSEPLLWFMLKVLDSTRMLSLFFDMGGVEVVCRNIVMCNNRLISTCPSMVSTMMQSMIGKASSIDKKKAWDSELTDGLLNFAPLGTITSSSPTASPAEVLIAASPQHRRARSAAWSYHFYPDEAWVDLTISLPFAILLKEVQIQPHNASLSTCPAHVSLEISHDGVTTFPLCAPMMTSSLASIKLQLQQLEVVASVTIRLHRARDSMTIGLSQILLMGYSAFGDAGMYKTNNIFQPIEDSVSRSSVGWVRLLHHCLTSRRELEDKVAEAAAHISGLLNTCTALLISPTSGMDIPHVETVLLKLGLHSGEMGLALIDNLLRSPTYGPETGHPSHYLGKINGMGNNSTVELLYQLGMHQDAWTKDRIQAMLHWLVDSARLALQKTSGFASNGFQSTPRETRFSLSEPSPAHIHCIASVLWQSNENNQQNNFSQLISKEIISSLYKWSSVLSTDSSLKEALDYVLCSMCYMQSVYFSQVLTWMGIVISTDINMMAPIPDDRKDSSQYNSASMTDDSKEANNASREQPVDSMTSHHPTETTPFTLQDVKHICLDKSNLGTLSRVCKSPLAIKHLLETGFPAVLAQGLFEFCNYVISQFTESWSQSEGVSDSRKTVNSLRCTTSSQSSSELNHKGLSITAATVAAVLDFFSQISSENAMKDWFGGADGNIFWPVLLTMLCNIPLHSPIVAGTIPQKYELMSVEDRMAIETSTIRFFTHVVSCHVDNQMLFAKVLCDVIKEQGNTVKTGLSVCPLSGFTRRLLLQVLLEDEKVLVAFRADPSQHWTQVFNSANSVQHPRFGAGRQFRTVHVNMHTTFSELVNEVSDMAYLKAAQLLEKKPDDTKKDSTQVGLELVEYISSVNSGSFSAHNTTEKQEKLISSAGSKSSLPPRPPTRRGRNTADTFAKQFQYQPVLSVYHPFFKQKRLPPGFSVTQLLQVLQQQEECQGEKSLEFTLRLHMRSKDKVSSSTGMFLLEEIEDEADDFSDEVLLSSPPFPTALQVFASIGGLALLAEHLPLLYPEISRQITASDMHSSEASAHDISQEWVQLEPYPEEFYELYEPMSPAPQSGRVSSHPLGTMPSIPPHSLVAFGLFLRLPGYAEVLLKERKKAQCLLRLVLGVTDNGNGGCILTSPISGALPTFPFLVLKSLFDNTPLTTDDGVLLRRMSQDIGVLHLILACLSVLSHHAPRVSSTGFQHETQILLSAMQYTTNPSSSQSASNSVEEKALQQQQQQQHYWAKGTGFGTGSTTSSWDAEQALLRQKSEEEHVTCLLQVLASFINPGGSVPDDFFHESYVPSAEKSLPDIIPDLLSQSCLVPALSSYLRNDSVLDMARHVPLYRALLELMRGLAMCPTLVHLLMPLDKQASTGDTGLSVGNLLEKMRGCVDTYANRLKGNKDKAGGGSREEEEENEGLALLIPDIQETARIVHISTERLSKEENSKRGAAANSDGDVVPRGRSSQKSLDDRYLAIMKRLQFDTYQMVSDEGTTIRFHVHHHYENNVKAAGDIKNPARIRRLAQEAVTLSTSLPLSVSSSVFVRCDEDRLDIMKVLITGPEDTPYANGCFEFDVYFPQDYPIAPPYINLETTGNHTVRFNPNLYNDGKVCLSILNTWHGRPEEKWNSQTSSFLQVLVSIQSLILVSEPYFNEPGYERSRGTPSGTASSREYDANIRQATVKWAMLEQLRNPSPCFREVIQNHFWLKRHRILQQCQVWISEMETYSTDKRTGRTIAHSTMTLKRHYNQLREEFARMKPISGEEEESEEKIDPKEQQYDTDQATGSSQNGSPLLMLDILATDPNANSLMNPEAVNQIVCNVDHTELDTSVDLTEIDSCLNPPGVPDC
ncbi:hypothetical protein CHS0354_014586 [Potamilus streckersoni]|uniref:Dual E2 ubiquitin-conjugating enzyme/E3 ubiquitin-protein ligase BIRC6 n=1 Tax=Potamilus streckersoni TaxID=2493646 RepID=A0AAE0RNM8_9BIVA|nr:hypothetical protein CHS0354_014586 [Potamilus streckersoni]